MTAALPLVASASETVELSAPAATTATVVAGTDVAAPTAGADLAMWNASPAKAEGTGSAAATISPAHLSKMLHVQRFASGIAARGAAMASNLTHNALKFLGVPYAFGGTSAYGFDCSGYVQHVFAMMGTHLPRTADAQYDVAHRITGAPQAGDLVFFHTYAPGVSHVGIALGGGRFVHASSSHGVTVSSLSDSYWAPRYLGAKRVVVN